MNNQQALKAGQAALDNAVEPEENTELQSTMDRLRAEFAEDGECRWFTHADVIDRADTDYGDEWRECVRAVACDEPGSLELMGALVQQAFDDCLFDAAMEVMGDE